MADMDFWQLLSKIQQEYPQAIPLLSQPGVLQVYADAINNTWAPDRIQSALENTDWWKNTPDTARQWQALQITDPATAAQKLQQYSEWINDAMAQTGVKLDTAGGMASPSFQFFAKAVTQGWDQSRVKYELLAQSNPSANTGGDIGGNAAQIRALASEYALPMSDAAIMQYAKQMSQGAIDMNGVKGYIVSQAKSLFPQLSAAIDSGVTVKQFAAPYVQMAQQELNVNPDSINFTDPKWMRLLNQVDPKTGQRAPMPLDQALQTMRTDPVYGYDSTHQAGADATALANAIDQKMGASA